jgi:hypothetical protein
MIEVNLRPVELLIPSDVMLAFHEKRIRLLRLSSRSEYGWRDVSPECWKRLCYLGERENVVSEAFVTTFRLDAWLKTADLRFATNRQPTHYAAVIEGRRGQTPKSEAYQVLWFPQLGKLLIEDCSERLQDIIKDYLVETITPVMPLVTEKMGHYRYRKEGY